MTLRPASWKRPILFVLSLAMIAAAVVGGYLQLRHTWTNVGAWLVLMPCIAGLIGLAVSWLGSDRLVARILGDF